jgi:hypothetical protein
VQNCNDPDIYYFILDGYSSSAALKEQFGWENKEMDSFLRENKFYVAGMSRSNYNLTPFSLSSTFNLDYLNRVDTVKDYFQYDFMPGIYSVYHNEWFPILEKEGYKIFNLSIFDVKNHPSLIPGFDMWDQRFLFQRYNLALSAWNDIAWNFHLPTNKADDPLEYAHQRDRQLEQTIQTFKEKAGTEKQKPVFFYTHLFIPHSPYTFDSTGPRSHPAFYLTPEEDKKRYIEQLQYCNRLIRELTNLTLAKKKQQSSVGDHPAG